MNEEDLKLFRQIAKARSLLAFSATKQRLEGKGEVHHIGDL
jgi:hypothetical protein